MNNNIKFNIKLASFKKINSSKNKHIGKKYQAIVIKENDIFKAKLISSPVEDTKLFRKISILPFTEESFNLRNSTHIYSKKRDKSNHYICIIRKPIEAKLGPINDSNFSTLREGLKIEGHIYIKDNIYYFNYEKLLLPNET